MAHLQNATRLQHQQDVRVDDGVQPVCVWVGIQTNLVHCFVPRFVPPSLPSSLSLFLPVRNHQDRRRGEALADGPLNLFEVGNRYRENGGGE